MADDAVWEASMLDWSGTGFYGKAVGPGDVLRLVHAPTEAEADRAYWRLDGTVCMNQCIYRQAVPVTHLLLALEPAWSPAARMLCLDLLIEICSTDRHENAPHARAACLAMVRDAAWPLLHGLQFGAAGYLDRYADLSFILAEEFPRLRPMVRAYLGRALGRGLPERVRFSVERDAFFLDNPGAERFQRSTRRRPPLALRLPGWMAPRRLPWEATLLDWSRRGSDGEPVRPRDVLRLVDAPTGAEADRACRQLTGAVHAEGALHDVALPVTQMLLALQPRWTAAARPFCLGVLQRIAATATTKGAGDTGRQCVAELRSSLWTFLHGLQFAPAGELRAHVTVVSCIAHEHSDLRPTATAYLERTLRRADAGEAADFIRERLASLRPPGSEVRLPGDASGETAADG